MIHSKSAKVSGGTAQKSPVEQRKSLRWNSAKVSGETAQKSPVKQRKSLR
jgi:hypothetical protein